MKYFKCQRDYVDIYRKGGIIKSLVLNELITEKEAKKMGIYFLVTSSPKFVQVEISSKNTYKSFGCRFECH